MSFPKACRSSGLKTASTNGIITNGGTVCGVDLVNNGGAAVVSVVVHDVATFAAGTVANTLCKLSLPATDGVSVHVDFTFPIAFLKGISLVIVGAEAEVVVRYMDLKLNNLSSFHG